MTATPPRSLARSLVVALCFAAAVSDAQPLPATTQALAPIPMDSLASDARRILETRCVRCHGDGTTSGTMGSVRSIDGLVRDGFVLRGRPDDSPLVQRLSPTGDMPLRAPPLAEFERETLRRWIRAGAPAIDQSATAVQRVRTEERDVLRAMLDDLSTLPETSRPFTRYFTLHHLHNAALSDPQWTVRRQELEDALLVLLNSLSWQRNLQRFHALADGLVLRFDLRRVGWTSAQWDTLVRHYPYAARPASDVGEGVVAHMALPSATAVPALRGDWFVANASLSPLYESLLQLPGTRAELERLLRVDVGANLRQFTAARAGFRQSGVSHNNRVIERHESMFGTYWQSFDFADSVGHHDVFQHPLGPGSQEGEFDPSGGEIIFTLPNGLQGYLLVNASGRRIADAPPGIVHDGTNPADPVIHNAVSCMGCHGFDGIKMKDDEVRAAVENAGADADRVRAVEALYAAGREWREVVQGDGTRYRQALSLLLPTAGGSQVPLLPVVTVARRFAAPLDALAVAAALELSRDELTQRVSSSTGRLRQLVGPVLGGATLARDQFDCSWRELAAELGDVQLPAEAGREIRNCGSASAAARPEAPRVACRTEWRQVRLFDASASGSAWQQDAACEQARASLGDRVVPVCVSEGSTMGSIADVRCNCRQAYDAQRARNFWVCSTAGAVSCGRYEQVCGAR